ncbi:MAG: hypothetical protein ACREXM_17975 [Gammaproteobacteria bacterium]
MAVMLQYWGVWLIGIAILMTLATDGEARPYGPSTGLSGQAASRW